MVVSYFQKFHAENCSELNIRLDNQPISRVRHAKSFGLIIDDRPSWSNYIKELYRKISSSMGALVSQSTAVKIYNALIQPHFDCCAPVWDGLSSYICEKIQKLQNLRRESELDVARLFFTLQSHRASRISSLSSSIPPPTSLVVICKRRGEMCGYTGRHSRNPAHKRPSALGC